MNNFNYSNIKIQLINAKENIQGKIVCKNHQLIYILQGRLIFSNGYYNNRNSKKGELIFLPIGECIEYQIGKATMLMLLHIIDTEEISGCYRKNALTAKVRHIAGKKKKTNLYSALYANKFVLKFMEDLALNINKGLNEEEYFNIKIKELLYLLGATYSDKELENLFSSSVFSENAFSAYILRNNHIYNSVAEISSAMNYTISGFEKRFKKTFGVPPAKWLREQKAKRIYQEVCHGKYNFKEIAHKYNFASTSTFNDFYKFTFGETPGSTRKKIEDEKISKASSSSPSLD